jgi:hypothetical protein
MSSDNLLGCGGPIGLGVDGPRRDRVDPDLLATQLAGELLGDIGHHDRRTLAGQRLGVRLADTTTRPGDDGDFVFKSHADELL